MDQRVSCKNILISLQKQIQNNTHAIVIIYRYITVRLFLRPKRPLPTPGRFVVSGRRNIGNDRSDHCRDRQRATTELLTRRHSGAVARGRFGTGGHERRRRAGHGPGRVSGTLRVAAAIERARKFIGQPYDYSFRPDNGKMYCSELVWESYLAPDGSRRFPARPMNFLAADGSLPRFWAELFAGLGEEIPQDIPGTNPNDMARDPQLKEVTRYY